MELAKSKVDEENLEENLMLSSNETHRIIVEEPVYDDNLKGEYAPYPRYQQPRSRGGCYECIEALLCCTLCLSCINNCFVCCDLCCY